MNGYVWMVETEVLMTIPRVFTLQVILRVQAV